jgi:hypothetical protein
MRSTSFVTIPGAVLCKQKRGDVEKEKITAHSCSINRVSKHKYPAFSVARIVITNVSVAAGGIFSKARSKPSISR